MQYIIGRKNNMKIRYFYNECGYMETNKDVKADYKQMCKQGDNIDGISFASYLHNCMATEGGVLTEVTKEEYDLGADEYERLMVDEL